MVPDVGRGPAGHPVHSGSVSVDPGLSASVEGGPVAPAGAAPAQPRQRAARRAARTRGRSSSPPTAVAEVVGATRSPRSGGEAQAVVGRRVRRVVRRIDLWSVLKVALIFNTIMLGICLGAVAVLWGLASTTGLVDDLEGFLRDSGFEDFRFDGDRMFTQVAFIGAVLTLATTVLLVLAAALLNLISEMTGGIRFTVIEEVTERRPQAASPPVAAPPGPPPARRPAPAPGPSPAPAAAPPRAARAEPPRGPGGPPAGGIAR